MANQQLMTRTSKKKTKTVKQTQPVIKGGFVDLKGAVAHPGIYPIHVSQTRLFEVLKQAGDVTEAADTSQLNLAQTLVDQLIIYVPTNGEAVSAQELVKIAEKPTIASIANNADHEQETDQDTTTTKINLNQADVTQLQTLNGIGPKKAEQIITYRDEQGQFKQIEDLQKVGGIGPKTFEQLRTQICVN
ncbi:comE operon protein 1 [Latilactobacillus graminis DSM 20719]|uniref:ComE operon protein 1 n=1 Tax=Latilactobacillus graminis DSM 20719 TaxID=1423752 RepID=A0AA89KXX6_9LACO|nr:comE operon protein 1 [Latilactobacillus graminis DSM 20719]